MDRLQRIRDAIRDVLFRCETLEGKRVLPQRESIQPCRSRLKGVLLRSLGVGFLNTIRILARDVVSESNTLGASQCRVLEAF